MNMGIPTILNQVALGLGFASAILLWLSPAVGGIYKGKDGSISINYGEQDPNAPTELKRKRVCSSHWRKRWFTPWGWGMLALSFLLQILVPWLPMLLALLAR